MALGQNEKERELFCATQQRVALICTSTTSWRKDGLGLGRIECHHEIRAPRSEVFAVLTRPQTLQSLVHPLLHVKWEQPKWEQPLSELAEQSEMELWIARHGVAVRARVRIDEVCAPTCLRYHQVRGIFKFWSHRQTLIVGTDLISTVLMDQIEFALPFGLLGSLLDDLWIKKSIVAMLNHRAQSIRQSLERRLPQAKETVHSKISGIEP